MCREYLGSSSGFTTLCIQQLVLIIFLDDCLLSWLYFNPTRTTDIYLKRIISTTCFIHTIVTPDGGPRYTRNMKRLTKYTKNKLCIKLVSLYTIKDFNCEVWNSFLYHVDLGFGPVSDPVGTCCKGYISRSFRGSNPESLNRKHKFHLHIVVFSYLHLIGLNWSYEVLKWRNTHVQWGL
jgi:hypothetical protein